MNWFQNIWPKRANATLNRDVETGLAPSYAYDLKSPDELINRATKRAFRGDIDGAIADFNAAIERSPNRGTTFYSRACLHNLAGNYEQAIDDCSEAIALLPNYDEAFYQRGVAQLELGNLDAAVIDMSEVLRLNPFSIKTYYRRARCYAAQDNVPGAVSDYTQAILRVPKDARAYLQRGLYLITLGEYRTALEDFSSALSMNPKHGAAYYHRGYCHAQLGQKEQATQDFNQATLYNPKLKGAEFNPSYALDAAQETKQLPPAPPSEPAEADTPMVTLPDSEQVSLPHVDETILDGTNPTPEIHHQDSPLSPPSPPVVEVPAAIEPMNREPVNAVGTDPAVGTNPKEHDIGRLFYRGQQQAAAGDHDGAVKTYSEILELDPDYAQAYLERGRSLSVLGAVDRAAEDLAAAVHSAKQKSLALMKDYSGTLSETLKDLKLDSPVELTAPEENQSIEAEILKYSKLIHRNPLNATAYCERAKSRALLGDLDGAIADYTRTISLDAEHPEAYYKRGMLLEALGDSDGATQDFNRAIRRSPNSFSSLDPKLEEKNGSEDSSIKADAASPQPAQVKTQTPSDVVASDVLNSESPMDPASLLDGE